MLTTKGAARIILFGVVAVLSVVQDACASECPLSKECVTLRQCAPMLKLLRSRKPNARKTLKKAMCGFQGLDAKVCCDISPMVTHPTQPVNSPSVSHSATQTPPTLVTTTRSVISSSPKDETRRPRRPSVNRPDISSTHSSDPTHSGYRGRRPARRRPARRRPSRYRESPPTKSPVAVPTTPVPTVVSKPHTLREATTQRPAGGAQTSRVTAAPLFSASREPISGVTAAPPFQLNTPDTKNVSSSGPDSSRRRPAPPVQPNRAAELWPAQCGLSIAGFRIYGGSDTMLGAFPWTAVIGYSTPDNADLQYYCGGTLITARYVVSAAHCLDRRETRDRKPVEVRLGEWKISSNPDCDGGKRWCAPPVQDFAIQRIIIHPDYNNPFRFYNDIALIRLSSSVSFNRFIGPLCLPPRVLTSSDVSIGQSAVVVGWGLTETGESSDYLKQVQLKIVNPLNCGAHFPNNFQVNGNQLCMGGRRGEDSCGGDSGGPAMIPTDSGRYYLLGITSYGSSHCGKEGVPGVYTAVAQFTSWIRDSVHP